MPRMKPLTQNQIDWITTNGRKGSPRGLIARGLLRFKWGNNSAFGYDFTTEGRSIRNALLREQQTA